MNLHDIENYRNKKDDKMRHGYLSEKENGAMHDLHTQDMFGGMDGIDPNSHGAELQ